MDGLAAEDLEVIPCSADGAAGLVALRRFFAERMAGRHALAMAERRAGFAGLMTSLFPSDAAAPPRRVVLGAVPVEVHEPGGAPALANVLYLHGGAFVSGGPPTHRHFAAALARAAQARVLLADYRLAPENPFPAALDDAHAAFRAARDAHPDAPLMVGGDSAGGNLALGLTQRLRDAGERLPDGLVLLSPFVDLSLSLPSHQLVADRDPFLTTAGLAADVARYLGGAAAPADPRVSPLFAACDRLPPTLLQVGSDEILIDEARRLTQALRTAGVAVSAELWAGMVHDWHLFPNWLPEAELATGRIAAFIRQIASVATAPSTQQEREIP